MRTATRSRIPSTTVRTRPTRTRPTRMATASETPVTNRECDSLPDRAWRVLATFLLGGLLCVGGRADAASLLFLDSEPGDYIGDGRHQLFTGDVGEFAATTDGPENVHFTLHGPVFWDVILRAPVGERLAPGSYEATDYPGPSISIFGDGRGCNPSTGRFEVLDAVFAPDGEVLSFAADFEQHCYPGSPALFGAVRFHTGDTTCGSIPDDSPCDDRDACTTGDRCVLGRCFGSARLACAAAPDQCHDAEVCDPSGGVCLPTTPSVNFTSCDDGNACTTQDYCQEGVCVGSSFSMLDCRDSDDCTDDVCDPAVGCRHLPIAGRCGVTGVPSTFLFATGIPPFGVVEQAPVLLTGADDTVSITTGYRGGVSIAFSPPPPLPGAPPPSEPSAAMSFWSLVFTAPGGARLVPGAYEHAGPTSKVSRRPGLDVSGGFACGDATGRYVVLEATYDPLGNILTFAADFEYHCAPDTPPIFGAVRVRAGDTSCFGAPDGAPCDDRNACTGSSTCHGGTCVGGDPLDCQAVDGCHEKRVCDPTSAACVDAPTLADGSACDQPAACLTGGTCHAGVCEGGDSTCDDNNVCTKDTCVAGACTHAPTEGSCWRLSGTLEHTITANGRSCSCRQPFGPSALSLAADGTFTFPGGRSLCGTDPPK